MLETIPGHIDTIVKKLDQLAPIYPELVRLIEGAKSAIASSLPRILLDEKRTSKRARMTVVYVVAPIINAIIKSDEPGDSVARILLRLLATEKAISDDHIFDHDPVEISDMPAGWRDVGEGLIDITFPLSTVTYTISNRRHMPGGSWTLYFYHVPVASAETLDETVDLTLKLDRLLAQPMKNRRLPFFPVTKPDRNKASEFLIATPRI